MQIEKILNLKERIHHIDGNKSNNKLDNLLLFKNNSEHIKFHYKINEFTYKLIREGKIKYNEKTKELYEYNKKN